MVLLQTIENAGFHRQMVNRIVNSVVTNIACNEAGPNRRRGVTEGQNEQAIKYDRQRNAYGRRHHQPLRVVRIVVMNTVKDKMELLPDSRPRFVMEKISMNDVLEQSPDCQAQDKKPGHGQDRKL